MGHVSIRLPDDLDKRLAVYCMQSKRSRTEAVLDAIRVLLDARDVRLTSMAELSADLIPPEGDASVQATDVERILRDRLRGDAA